MRQVCFQAVLKHFCSSSTSRNGCKQPGSAFHKWHKQLFSTSHSWHKEYPIPESAQSLFTYTHVITRHVPQSFVKGALRNDDTRQVIFPRAVQQLENYIDIFKRLGLKVITLPADERYPDCPFVEDAAVVIGRRACMTHPGHPSRKGEVSAVKQVLENLGFEIRHLDDPTAFLDGGDVLFTGQEILMGESLRSNKAAAESLQRAFPEFPVILIPVKVQLHLKSSLTLAQEGVLVSGGSDHALEALETLQSKVQGKYKFIQLSNDASANMIFVNGQTVIKSESEMGPDDFKTLTSELTVPTVVTEFSEFYKVDGCLTCCSILLRVV